MSEGQNKNSNDDYRIYLEERRELIHAEQSMYQRFDKAILTLSAGALGISITFINQIAPNPKADTKFLIIIAWSSFLLSAFSTLISFLTSQSACRKQIEICERILLDKKAERGVKENKFATATKWLNYIAILFFIIGVMFLVLFCFKNLPFK